MKLEEEMEPDLQPSRFILNTFLPKLSKARKYWTFDFWSHAAWIFLQQMMKLNSLMCFPFITNLKFCASFHASEICEVEQSFIVFPPWVFIFDQGYILVYVHIEINLIVVYFSFPMKWRFSALSYFFLICNKCRRNGRTGKCSIILLSKAVSFSKYVLRLF